MFIFGGEYGANQDGVVCWRSVGGLFDGWFSGYAVSRGQGETDVGEEWRSKQAKKRIASRSLGLFRDDDGSLR